MWALPTCYTYDVARVNMVASYFFGAHGQEPFAPEKEPGSEDTRRSRSDFKDAVENILCDALGAFTRAEIAKLNPYPDDKFHVFQWEDKLDTLFFSRLPCLFTRTTGDFDSRQAADEIIIEAKQDSKSFWKIATHGVARRLKQDASTIHQPDNVQSLEDDFWRRVDAAVTEALEQGG